MDKTARRIIEIDRDTIRLKEKTDQVLKEKKENFQLELKRLEEKFREEGEIEGEEIYKEIIKEGKKVIEEQERQTNRVLNGLENLYKGKKEALIDELWNDLFIEE